MIYENSWYVKYVPKCPYEGAHLGSSLVVQLLGLWAFTAKGVGSVPGQGTEKILQAVQQGQKGKKKGKKKMLISYF